MSLPPTRFAVLSTLVAGLLAAVVLAAQPQAPAPNQATLMQRKLDSAQSILRALATEDFDAMHASADDLLRIARQQWRTQETPEYRAQLKDFWTVLEGLQATAQDRNLDGATLSYVQLTISCVQCHKALRRAVE